MSARISHTLLLLLLLKMAILTTLLNLSTYD